MVQDCTNPTRQYAHRREWRLHMESHEKHWLCPYNCPGAFTSAEQFENHLQTEHLVEAPMLATLSKSCARKSNLAEFRACTLCERPITDSGSWFSHVGHHLEQLALFALPSHLISATLIWKRRQLVMWKQRIPVILCLIVKSLKDDKSIIEWTWMVRRIYLEASC